MSVNVHVGFVKQNLFDESGATTNGGGLLPHRDGEASLVVMPLGRHTQAPRGGGAFAERRGVCHVRVTVIRVHDTHGVAGLERLAHAERVAQRIAFSAHRELGFQTRGRLRVELARDAQAVHDMLTKVPTSTMTTMLGIC